MKQAIYLLKKPFNIKLSRKTSITHCPEVNVLYICGAIQNYRDRYWFINLLSAPKLPARQQRLPN
jgi:hypothetical protein